MRFRLTFSTATKPVPSYLTAKVTFNTDEHLTFNKEAAWVTLCGRAITQKNIPISRDSLLRRFLKGSASAGRTCPVCAEQVLGQPVSVFSH